MNVNANDIHKFQEELRLVSRPDQALRWITGAYFERASQFYPQNLTSPGFDSIFGAEIGDPTFNSQTDYGTPAPNTPFYGTINLVERQFALAGFDLVSKQMIGPTDDPERQSMVVYELVRR